MPLIGSTRKPEPRGIRQTVGAVGERADLITGKTVFRAFVVAYTDFTKSFYAAGQRKV